jgi:hypothetical protein
MRADPSSGERPVHHGSPVAAPGNSAEAGVALLPLVVPLLITTGWIARR